jgi:hypothetical protein
MSDIGIRERPAHGRLALRSRERRYRFLVSDKITALIERNHLSDLVLATAQPEVSAHTIPRVLIPLRDPAPATEIVDDYMDGEQNVSPLAVLIVMGMLLAVFVAIVQL